MMKAAGTEYCNSTSRLLSRIPVESSWEFSKIPSHLILGAKRFHYNVIMWVLHIGSISRGAKPVPCYNRICVINSRIIMRFQC